MKKAFIILAHQLPVQLNLFTRQILAEGDNEVFIHVNKLCESIIPSITKNDRIHISQNNIDIHWGSDEILKAILIMLKEVLSYEKNFDYVLVCTGQDLLINENLDDILNTCGNKVIIEQCKAEGDFYDRYVKGRLLYKWPTLYRRKYDFRYHPIRIMRALRYRYTLTGKWPFSKKNINWDVSKMTFYKDWFWCALPIDIVQYITSFIHDNPNYWSIYKDGYIPEEGFVTTLLMNNGLGHRILDRQLTFIKPMINNHPPVFVEGDIKELEESGCPLARKFDLGVDSNVITYFVNKITKNTL